MLRLPENDAAAQEWANTVGRFFQASAVLETIAMEFISTMANGFKYKSIKKKYLSQKLTWIIDNIGEHADADGETLGAINEALEGVRQLSFFRNDLCHGALGLAKPAADAGAAPTISGILNYRPDDADEEAEIISLDEIQGRLQEAETLAAKLAGLFNGLKFAPLEPA